MSEEAADQSWAGTYHEAYGALRRLGLAVDRRPTSGQYHLAPDAADALRAEHQRVQELHRRSIKLAAAARQLKIALSTAALLSRTGQLDVDPETDSSAARFVTRTSVEAYWLSRRRASARGGPAGMLVGEIARFTGRREREVLDPIHGGILEQVPGRRRCEITIESLRCWLATQPQDSSRATQHEITVDVH